MGLVFGIYVVYFLLAGLYYALQFDFAAVQLAQNLPSIPGVAVII